MFLCVTMVLRVDGLYRYVHPPAPPTARRRRPLLYVRDERRFETVPVSTSLSKILLLCRFAHDRNAFVPFCGLQRVKHEDLVRTFVLGKHLATCSRTFMCFHVEYRSKHNGALLYCMLLTPRCWFLYLLHSLPWLIQNPYPSLISFKSNWPNASQFVNPTIINRARRHLRYVEVAHCMALFSTLLQYSHHLFLSLNFLGNKGNGRKAPAPAETVNKVEMRLGTN